jgi:hypothetical protein
VVACPTADGRFEPVEPARCAVGALGERARDRRAGVLAGERLEDCSADPEHGPGKRQPACRRFVGTIALRPGGERERAVEQRGSRRAGQQARVPAGEAGQTLAEEPHPKRPGDRDGERKPGRARDEQPEPDQQLGRCERHVPRDRVGRDHARGPVDGSGDKVGLPITGGGKDLVGEAGSEHERLELKRAVQQPKKSKHDLQITASDATAM